MSSQPSPYLTSPSRLADVIAAIQTLGSYKFYKLDFAGWADRISADKGKAEHWKAVFEEHPEFFRLDSTGHKASLVWRRQSRKAWQVDEERLVALPEYQAMSDERKDRVSRVPLSASDIQALIKTATDLHSRALETQREKRWLLPLIIGALGGILAGAAEPSVKWLLGL